MVFSCPPEFIAFAHRLAEASRPIIQHYYRSRDLAIIHKDDDTPVTRADRETEEKLREMIAQHYPDHGIIGEEYGRSNDSAEITWILDPVDGTKPFTLGRPTFACLIGLHHHKHGFIAGITDQAITGDRWAAATGHGATCNGKGIAATSYDGLKTARFSITNPTRLHKEQKKLHDALLPQVAFIHYGGDAFNFTGVADGGLHATFEAGQKIHDIAAMIPMITETGGRITQMDGSAIDLDMGDTVLAACTPELHRVLLEMWKSETF